MGAHIRDMQVKVGVNGEVYRILTNGPGRTAVQPLSKGLAGDWGNPLPVEAIGPELRRIIEACEAMFVS